jgi:hypothetical protein
LQLRSLGGLTAILLKMHLQGALCFGNAAKSASVPVKSRKMRLKAGKICRLGNMGRLIPRELAGAQSVMSEEKHAVQRVVGAVN